MKVVWIQKIKKRKKTNEISDSKSKQRSVEVEGNCVGKIKKGFLVLVGIGKEDTRETVDQYIKKMVNLRIFADENGKSIFLWQMLTEKCFWYLSLPCMPTVKRATVQVFLMQENQIRRKLYMNIW